MFTDCPSCARAFHTDGGTVACPRCEPGRSLAAPVTQTIVPGGREHRRERVELTVPRRGAPSWTPVVIALGGLVLATGLLAARTTIVRTIPRTAGLYAAAGLPVNVRGLAWVDVRTAWPDESMARVEVSGRIRNVAAGRTAVPRLAFAFRDAAGTVLASWSERPAKHTLAVNETLVFATQARPTPKGATEVVVRFVDPDRERPLLAAAD